MYTTRNFKTKRELKLAVTGYISWRASDHTLPPPEPVTLFAPGLGSPKRDGVEFVEGPHYPEPHKWYAQVTVKDGIVVAVK